MKFTKPLLMKTNFNHFLFEIHQSMSEDPKIPAWSYLITLFKKMVCDDNDLTDCN